MTSKEAKIKLDRDFLLKKRNNSRIFGNIDNTEKELQILEIFNLTMIETEFIKKVRTAMERDNVFYSNLLNKK